MDSDGSTGTGRRRGGLEGPLREDEVAAVAVVAVAVAPRVEAAEEVKRADEDEDDATTGARKSTGMRRACFARADK